MTVSETLLHRDNSAESHRSMAHVLVYGEKWKEAAEYYEKSLDGLSAPVHIYYVHQGLGICKDELKNYADASDECDAALRALEALPLHKRDTPAMQDLKQDALLFKSIYENSLSHHDRVAELLTQAKDCDSTEPLSGHWIDMLTCAWNTKDGIDGLTEHIHTLSTEELDRWLKLALECRYDTALYRFEDAAKKAGQLDFLVLTLLRIVQQLGRTPKSVYARYRLAETYKFVLGNVTEAERILEKLVLERSVSEDVKLDLFLARQAYCDIIYQRFRKERKRSEKERLLTILEKLPQVEVEDLEASTLTIVQARMKRVVGGFEAFKEALDSAFKNCLKGLRDDSAANDIIAFRRLALVLSLMEGLERDAQIAYSLLFSDVNPRLSSGTEREKGEEPAAADVKDEEGGAEESKRGSEILKDDAPSNTEAESYDFIPYDPSRGSETQDLLETSLSWCNGCEDTYSSWTRPFYMCLICASCDLCPGCYKARIASKNENDIPEGHLKNYCGAGHRYLKGPVKGWVGVKDGILKFQIVDSGNNMEAPVMETIPFKDWLRDVEVKWEEAWENVWVDEAFIRDIL